MKWLTFSCFLSLALVVGDLTVRAQTHGQRAGSQPQQQLPQQKAAPSRDMPVREVQPPAAVGQRPQPQPVPQSPGVVHTLPAVAQKPSGALNKPPSASKKPVGVATPAPVNSPKQNFVGGWGEFRRFRPEGDFHRGGFHHRRRHSNFVIVYVNGAACWYPFYTAYPYYYDVPLAPTYDAGYYDSGASNVPYVDEGTGGGAVQAAPSYGELGRQWGQDLRREVAAWDDFVDYLRTYIIVAAPEVQAEFREAFIASYGINGAAAYDKAAQQAAQSSTQGPKIINMPPAR
jgi:hypothetical protein